MASPPALVLLLLALPAIAGCTEGAGPAGPTETAPPPASPTVEQAPASAPSAPAEERRWPVHVEGNTAAGACAAAGGQEVACHYEMTEEAFGSIEAEGLPLRLAGTLVWESVSPTSEQLTLYVPAYDDGAYHWEDGYPMAAGTSPLAFDLDLTMLQGHGLGLIVGNGYGAGVPTGYAFAQTPQDFVLDAVLTTTEA